MGEFDDDGELLRRRHRDPEPRLEARLVETRQHAARVRGLELRERVAAAVRGGLVEAAELLAELAVVPQDERDASRGKLARERELDDLVRRLELRRAGIAVAPDPHRDLVEAEAGGVEDDGAERSLETNRQREVAAERSGLEIGLEMEVVLDRTDVTGQTKS